MHKDYIMAETLAVKWWDDALAPGAFHVEVKVEGQPLTIELRKV